METGETIGPERQTLRNKRDDGDTSETVKTCGAAETRETIETEVHGGG